jgi:WD40 repeat protein
MRRMVLLTCLLCCIASAAAAEPKLELIVQTGHTKAITSVSRSADGGRVLTGSEAGLAILWDARTGEKLRTFKGHTGFVTGVSLSADGNLALTGAWDGSALWDARTGKKLLTFSGHGGV